MSNVLPDYRDFDPTFGHWLAGFIAGEGSFCICLPKHRHNVSISFRLQLRDDDNEILEEIQHRTGLGVLIAYPAYKTSKPQTSWQVHRKLECLALVHLLDQYSLRAKKAQDYAIWRRAVILWNKEGETTEVLRPLAKELIAGRIYNS